MWFPSRDVTAPASEPVTLAEAKAQCGIPSSDASRDAAIGAAVTAARIAVEARCAIRLVTQTVEMQCNKWIDLEDMPVAPIQSITSIAYIDVDGVAQTVDETDYRAWLNNLSPVVGPAYGRRWPDRQPGSRITVTAVCGYGDASAVPADIKAAILLAVGSHMSMHGRDITIRSEDVDGVGTTTWGGIVEVSKATDTAINAILSRYQRWPL